VEREYAWSRIGSQLEQAYQCASGSVPCTDAGTHGRNPDGSRAPTENRSIAARTR
jgi:hypothetical protein